MQSADARFPMFSLPNRCSGFRQNPQEVAMTQAQAVQGCVVCALEFALKAQHSTAQANAAQTTTSTVPPGRTKTQSTYSKATGDLYELGGGHGPSYSMRVSAPARGEPSLLRL